jgi:hypothetical protein
MLGTGVFRHIWKQPITSNWMIGGFVPNAAYCIYLLYETEAGPRLSGPGRAVLNSAARDGVSVWNHYESLNRNPPAGSQMFGVGQEDYCNRIEFLDGSRLWKGKNQCFLNGRCIAWRLIGTPGADAPYAEILRLRSF